MAKIALKKKTVSESTSLVSEIRHYARQIWLAGLGAYSRLGTEGSDYFKELVKAGEALRKKANRWSQVRSIRPMTVSRPASLR